MCSYYIFYVFCTDSTGTDVSVLVHIPLNDFSCDWTIYIFFRILYKGRYYLQMISYLSFLWNLKKKVKLNQFKITKTTLLLFFATTLEWCVWWFLCQVFGNKDISKNSILWYIRFLQRNNFSNNPKDILIHWCFKLKKKT